MKRGYIGVLVITICYLQGALSQYPPRSPDEDDDPYKYDDYNYNYDRYKYEDDYDEYDDDYEDDTPPPDNEYQTEPPPYDPYPDQPPDPRPILPDVELDLDDKPPSECTYTFTVKGDQLRSQCSGGGGPGANAIRDAVEDLHREVQRLKADNEDVKNKMNQMKKDYEDMVETVKRVEEGTASWKNLIEWPGQEDVFKPENASLIIKDEPAYKDCWDAHNQGNLKQGIYSLKPGKAPLAFFGYCDEDGWTVIQRRFDGSVDFAETFAHFSKGFGHLTGEFFLGNEKIHEITKQKDYELRAEVLGYNGKLYVANHDDFKVGDEMGHYEFSIGNMTDGNFRDVLTELNGVKFSAKDNDNDEWPTGNCADYYHGGFWLKNCGWDLHRRWCEGQGCMSWGERNAKKSVLKIRPMEAKGRGGAAGRRRKDKKRKDRRGRDRG